MVHKSARAHRGGAPQALPGAVRFHAGTTRVDFQVVLTARYLQTLH